MRVFYELPELKDINLSIGSFDAIHKGHLKLIKKLLELKGERFILSFFPPPFIYFGREKKVTFLPYEKEIILKDLPIDGVIFLSFNKDISLLEPEEFIKFIINRIRLKSVVVGERFRFGHKRKGDVDLLSKLGKKFGFNVISVVEEKNGKEKISSSKIRNLIKVGDIKEANKFLFRPYFVYGKINGTFLKTKKLKLLPPEGKYEVRIGRDKFIAYVKDSEIHLLNFTWDKETEVSFIKKV